MTAVSLEGHLLALAVDKAIDDMQYVCIMVAVLVVDHSRDLTPNHILEVCIATLPNRIPRTHGNVQTKTVVQED